MRQGISILLILSLFAPWTTQGAFLGFTRTSDLEAFQAQLDAIQRQINDLRDEINRPRGFVLGYPQNGLLGAATGSGLFPTSTLNNFQDGDTINAGDWNGLERKIGIDGSSDNSSLDWRLRASTSTDPGHKHTSSSITGYGIFGAVNATTITATTSITVGGVAVATKSTSSIQWTVSSETGDQDDIVWIAPVAGTITGVTAVNKASGTVPFNIAWGASAATASSSLKHAFTALQTITATTSSVSVSVNGSSTFSVGDIFRYLTVGASSTQFHFTMNYRE